MRQSLLYRMRHAIGVLRGKSVPVYARSLAGMSERAAPWRDDPHEQVRHYRHWVYVAVRAIASRVAGTPLDFYRTDTGKRLDEAHPLRRLMREVNPFDTAVSLWMRTMTFLELTGNAYWYAPRNALGAVTELWLLPSQSMRVLPDRERFVKGYLFRDGTVEETFDADEVIHLKYPSPVSSFYGAGPLQAAADAVDAHEAMKTAERRTFEHGVFPGLAVQTAERLSPDVRKRLEESLRQGFSGPERAGRALILEQGLSVRPFTYSPREMDFLESARVTRDEILAVFGVPAAVAGVSEDVNRASAEAMLWTFAENTILPKLRLLDAQLTQDLCSRFDARIEARFGSPLPEARADDRADMLARINAGVTTVNEERARLGMPPRAEPVPAPASPLAPSRPAATQPGTPDSSSTSGSSGTAASSGSSGSSGSSDKAAPHAQAADASSDGDAPARTESVRALRAALWGQWKRMTGFGAKDPRDTGTAGPGSPASPASSAGPASDLGTRIRAVLDDPRESDRLLSPLVPALMREGLARPDARREAEGVIATLMPEARALLLDGAPVSAATLRTCYADTLIPRAAALAEAIG